MCKICLVWGKSQHIVIGARILTGYYYFLYFMNFINATHCLWLQEFAGILILISSLPPPKKKQKTKKKNLFILPLAAFIILILFFFHLEYDVFECVLYVLVLILLIVL